MATNNFHSYRQCSNLFWRDPGGSNPLFISLPPAQRRKVAQDFIAFSLARDGEPDFIGRTLAKREARASAREEEWRELHAQKPMPQPEFDSYFADRTTIPTDPLVAWLISLARANEGEAWGVDYLLKRTAVHSATDSTWTPTARDIADLEEVYHSRTLAQLVGLFGGLQFSGREPAPLVAVLIRVMALMPQAIRHVLLLSGEIIGAIVFLDMSNHGRSLIEDKPHELTNAVGELLDEILADEIGHVTSLLASMNELQMRAVKVIFPLIGKAIAYSYAKDLREESARRRIMIDHFSLSLFPERILKRSFIPRHLASVV